MIIVDSRMTIHATRSCKEYEKHQGEGHVFVPSRMYGDITCPSCAREVLEQFEREHPPEVDEAFSMDVRVDYVKKTKRIGDRWAVFGKKSRRWWTVKRAFTNNAWEWQGITAV